MSLNFKLYSKYYNLLYADKDYHSEVAYVTDLIRKYSPKAKSVLEFGSGTGIHGLQLRGNGFEVYGLERSESMVSEAVSKGFHCRVADICNFNLTKKFDVVISLFHVISYLTANDNLISCFRNAHEHLADDGIFIFDVWYSPAVYNLKALPRIKKMKNEELSVYRFAEPVIDVNKNIVDVRYTVIAKDLQTNESSELVESHPMRHFSIPEIEILSEHTGFKILKVEEFLSGNLPGENTWGVCFILKRK